MEKKIYAVITLLTIAIVSFIIIYMFTADYNDGLLPVPISIQEKASITQVTFDNTNPNILLVTAKRIDNITENMNFIGAMLKNSEGNTVSVIELSNYTLPVNSEIIVKVPLANNLSSGKYSVNLATSAGGLFTGPTFIKP